MPVGNCDLISEIKRGKAFQMHDLRDWIAKIEGVGGLVRIDGADWNGEIGCLADLNLKSRRPSALLFDNIKEYAAGNRLLSGSLSTANHVAVTFRLPTGLSNLELLHILRRKLPEWNRGMDEFQPRKVRTGRVLENIHTGNDVNLLEFPSPKWHELDGGRYIGTGDAVVTSDPETGEINLGTYRIMVHDPKTTGLYISPGRHGGIHRERWHAAGKSCPVAVSFGHHPLVFAVGCVALPPGKEYPFVGAVMGEPMEVIEEEITGLPIPADSEIVVAGFCPPDKAKNEGPFGEWTGYYASKERTAPIIDVKRIYHRNNPIILGSHNAIPPSDSTYYSDLMRSARLYVELIEEGVPDVVGVWAGLQNLGIYFIVVAIRQRYAGHARQAALIASQARSGGGYHGRYVVVVDHDIDPSNTQEVLWAMCTRSDPEKDIDIVRRCWSTPLDPTIRKPTNAYFNSRAIIDACKPYEWIGEFPEEIRTHPDIVNEVKRKWGHLLTN